MSDPLSSGRGGPRRGRAAAAASNSTATCPASPRGRRANAVRRSTSSRRTDAVEVVVDVPGVRAEIAARRDPPRHACSSSARSWRRPADPTTRFHLAERSYGRFARAVRLAGAFDASRARAVASGGQLARRPAAHRGSPRPGARDPRGARHDAPALHRRHRRPAGPRARAPRPAGARRASPDRSRRSPTCENAAAGFGITPDIADDLLRVRRPRDDRRQSHVGQEGDHSRTSPISRGCCGRRIFPAGAPGRGRYVARAANGVPVAVINVMGRVFMTAIDDPFRVVRDEIEAVARRGAHHLRRLPRRGDVRESRDGLASRRPRHRRRRHAHARADRRRARAAAGHGVHHRRRHDRPARLRHRRRARGDHPAIPDGAAAALRDRDGKSAPQRRLVDADETTGRATSIERAQPVGAATSRRWSRNRPAPR